MRLPAILSLTLVFLSSLPAIAFGQATTEPASAVTKPVDYQSQIRHVLQERCFACHGALKQEAGLRLDTAAASRKGGDSGPAVVSGKPAESLLLSRVESKDLSVRMPPEGEALKPEQIDAIRNWIEQGAIAPEDERPEDEPRDHWAFRSPVRPTLPLISHREWVRNPIDAFIAERHDQTRLTAQPEADRRVWLRRVTIDLIGLPPSVDELKSFIADDSPEAYEHVVDRLLASPLYSERWGRHWMDIWRYSDWWGLGAEVRNSQKHIWHWRDWIVESLQDDKPYDQMLREMLAADELYPNDQNRLRASGFLARQYFKFNRTSWLDSTIEHTGKSMLGLTWNCCKCHDHKYDPFSQTDYYQLRAIFEPHQIRTDFVPGELDPEKDGIPRAFDCHLDAATYVHVRGDDRNPDQTKPLSPNVPAFLQFVPFEVQPVELPAEAIQPGLRPFVLDAALQRATGKIAEATLALDRANASLQRITEQTAASASGNSSTGTPDTNSAKSKVVVDEDFSVDRPELWERRGGRWTYSDGKLLQSDVGAERRSLRLKQNVPRDFEATLRYTPTGGQMWKSVGITFDVTEENNDTTVYVSSVEGGSKTQVSYQMSGNQVYPPEGAEPRPVALNQSHELTVKIRDTVVNVYVDGQKSVVYRLPIERRSGALELMTFDAAVALEHFTLKELSATEQLFEPVSGPVSSEPRSIEEARLFVIAAEKTLAAAQLEPETLRNRVTAERALVERPNEPTTKRLTEAAARSEQILKVAELKAKVAEAELAVHRAPADQKAKSEERLASDVASLKDAENVLSGPRDSFTPLAGALKTFENNLETEESRRQRFPSSSSGRRTAFARWVTDPRNPLTARVAVNHIWNRHFGRGLVTSVFDFGRKGAKPTHPELLDWLAVEFMENGWRMKHIHRLIVLSGTYRMTSSAAGANPQNLQSDIDNHFYWRRNPVRMEAQVVRDSLLNLANQLDLARGGPSIPVNDETSKRRSLYYVHSHNEHQPFLAMFDDAGVLECYRRAESIVPQQALALENSPLASQMAEHIAARVQSEQNASDDRRFIEEAFLMILNLPPTEDEISACEDALKALDTSTAPNVTSAKADPAKPSVSRARLIQALLNHNDFVTIR